MTIAEIKERWAKEPWRVIANATTDIPILLSEIDRQAAEIREQAEEIARLKEQRGNMINALAEGGYCPDEFPCPKDSLRIGCKGCLSRYFGVDLPPAPADGGWESVKGGA